MRRVTNLMAAMLVMTCAVAMFPQLARATIIGSLVNLLGQTEPEVALCFDRNTQVDLWNNTGRPVRIRVWTNYGDYAKYRFDNGEMLLVQSDAIWFGIEAAVWNKNTKKYVVMDYVECPRYSDIEFYKHAQGDFRLMLSVSRKSLSRQ